LDLFTSLYKGFAFCAGFGYLATTKTNAMSRVQANTVLIFLFCVLILAGACSDGPSVTPPEQVKTAFSSQFSDAADVVWNAEESGFRASFSRMGKPTKAYFTAEGTWVKTETELIASELPSVIVQTLFGAFPGKSVVTAAQVDSIGSEPFYRLTIQRKGNSSVIRLSTGGVILTTP
jgi:hypothetical protein